MKTEKLICEYCNAPVTMVNSYEDEEFFYCDNKHENDHAVLCENELAKRYYTRFGFFDCKYPPFTIELTTDVEWVEKLKW